MAHTLGEVSVHVGAEVGCLVEVAGEAGRAARVPRRPLRLEEVALPGERARGYEVQLVGVRVVVEDPGHVLVPRLQIGRPALPTLKAHSYLYVNERCPLRAWQGLSAYFVLRMAMAALPLSYAGAKLSSALPVEGSQWRGGCVRGRRGWRLWRGG